MIVNVVIVQEKTLLLTNKLFALSRLNVINPSVSLKSNDVLKI